jgi:GNAT superfamily N-acetyltransferase
MVIEILKMEDLEEALSVAQEIHAESVWQDIKYDPNSARAYVETIINNPKYGFILACKVDGKIVGGIVGAISKYPFSSDSFVDMYVLFIKKKFRGARCAVALIKAYIAVAKTYNVKEIRCGVNTPGNFEKAERLFAWCGFKKQGSSWTMQ